MLAYFSRIFFFLIENLDKMVAYFIWQGAGILASAVIRLQHHIRRCAAWQRPGYTKRSTWNVNTHTPNPSCLSIVQASLNLKHSHFWNYRILIMASVNVIYILTSKIWHGDINGGLRIYRYRPDESALLAHLFNFSAIVAAFTHVLWCCIPKWNLF